MSSNITVSDGIINAAEFDQEKRLLWILKEVNDRRSTTDWDLCEFLRDREKEKYFRLTTWGLVSRISWGILEPKKDFEEIKAFDRKKLTEVLDRIAVINLKKVPGGPRSNLKEIGDYLDKKPESRRKIINQIKSIAPKVIICGYTLGSLFYYNKLRDFDLKNDWGFKDQYGRFWINGWHPNAHKRHKKYFEEVRKIMNRCKTIDIPPLFKDYSN